MDDKFQCSEITADESNTGEVPPELEIDEISEYLAQSSKRSQAFSRNLRKYDFLGLVMLSIFSYLTFSLFVVICAFIIRAMELPEELLIRSNAKAAYEELSNTLRNTCISTDEDLDTFRQNLVKYEKILKDNRRCGLTGDSDQDEMWSFGHSAVFVFTVVSSIGIHVHFSFSLNYERESGILCFTR